MAGHGGGAWKVAYADFVTAMMAFFLVMWICGQDQKVKRAVSDYFGDPLTVKQGVSKEPYRAGSLFESLATGSMPLAESVAVGKGRNSYSKVLESNQVTKLVSDSIFSDKVTYRNWKDRASALREEALKLSGGTNTSEAALKGVTRQLANELESQMGRDAAKNAKGFFLDLIHETLTQVNWSEIADDLISH
jgi:chemotaxis protein MotB